MGKKLCTDRARISIAIASAAILLAAPGAIAQIGVIAGGGLLGWWLYRQSIATVVLPVEAHAARHNLAAAAALGLFFALLLVMPAIASATDHRLVAEFDSFYRSGSLVFGGG